MKLTADEKKIKKDLVMDWETQQLQLADFYREKKKPIFKLARAVRDIPGAGVSPRAGTYGLFIKKPNIDYFWVWQKIGNGWNGVNHVTSRKNIELLESNNFNKTIDVLEEGNTKLLADVYVHSGTKKKMTFADIKKDRADIWIVYLAAEDAEFDWPNGHWLQKIENVPMGGITSKVEKSQLVWRTHRENLLKGTKISTFKQLTSGFSDKELYGR